MRALESSPPELAASGQTTPRHAHTGRAAQACAVALHAPGEGSVRASARSQGPNAKRAVGAPAFARAVASGSGQPPRPGARARCAAGCRFPGPRARGADPAGGGGGGESASTPRAARGARNGARNTPPPGPGPIPPPHHTHPAASLSSLPPSNTQEIRNKPLPATDAAAPPPRPATAPRSIHRPIDRSPDLVRYGTP